MRNTIDRVFLDHPRTIDETYGEHFGVALGFSMRLIGAGLAALVHAFIPCLFEKTASRAIVDMHARIARRHHDAPAGEAAVNAR